VVQALENLLVANPFVGGVLVEEEKIPSCLKEEIAVAKRSQRLPFGDEGGRVGRVEGGGGGMGGVGGRGFGDGVGEGGGGCGGGRREGRRRGGKGKRGRMKEEGFKGMEEGGKERFRFSITNLKFGRVDIRVYLGGREGDGKEGEGITIPGDELPVEAKEKVAEGGVADDTIVYKGVDPFLGGKGELGRC
jgi:hypothetical protein